MTSLNHALIYAALAVAIVSLSACAPSTEGETKTWERHKQEAITLSMSYPAFKGAIASEQKKAQGVWDEAAQVTDSKAKAEKMKSANVIIGRLMGRINEVKYKSEGLEKTITKLGKLKLAGAASENRKVAMHNARKAVTDARTAMTNAKPTDGATAMAALKPIISALITARSTANTKLKRWSPKKASKPKKKKTN